MFSKDSIPFGLLAGIFVPIVAYALFLFLDDAIEAGDFQIQGSKFMGFDNLYPVLAIVCNLIPFHYFNKYRMDNAMRGVIIPTIVLIIIWGFKYGKFLF